MGLITIEKTIGNFDYLHPDKTEIAYSFIGLPDDIETKSIYFSDEYQYDLEVKIDEQYSSLDFARDLKRLIDDAYFFSTSMSYIEKVIKYLEENEEEQRFLLIEKLLEDYILEKKKILRRINGINNRIKELEGIREKLKK